MDNSREDSFISLAEVTGAVKKLPERQRPELRDIHPEMVKALEVVSLLQLAHLRSLMQRRSGTVSGIVSRASGSDR